jgi:uncharacterized peroxidase-related enzyme
MARVPLVKPETVDDPVIQQIFAWVTQMESAVPNHFFVELNFPEYMKAKLGSTKVLWEMGDLTMQEIQHVGIAVSKQNGCPYCTAAFSTVLHYGLQADEEYVQQFVTKGVESVTDHRLSVLVQYALKVNNGPGTVTDADIDELHAVGLSNKGVVQLTHLVSDFASYNRLNLALNTDYDYRDLWRQLAFDWTLAQGDTPGDNTRGMRS